MKVIAPERVFLVALNDWVDGVCDVPDDVGEQLVAQGWNQPAAKPAKTAAKAEED